MPGFVRVSAAQSGEQTNSGFSSIPPRRGCIRAARSATAMDALLPVHAHL
jgi:hypothetical protein